MKKESKTIKEEIEEIIKSEWRPNDGVPPSFVAEQIYAVLHRTIQRFIKEKYNEYKKLYPYTFEGGSWRGEPTFLDWLLKEINQK